VGVIERFVFFRIIALVGQGIDNADTFLTSAVEDAHSDGKRLVRIQAEIVASNFPVLGNRLLIDQHAVPGDGVNAV
jgi:hypothetical protein